LKQEMTIMMMMMMMMIIIIIIIIFIFSSLFSPWDYVLISPRFLRW